MKKTIAKLLEDARGWLDEFDCCVHVMGDDDFNAKSIKAVYRLTEATAIIEEAFNLLSTSTEKNEA